MHDKAFHEDSDSVIIKHLGTRKGSLWFCRGLKLFSQLVSLTASISVRPKYCLTHKGRLLIWSEPVQLFFSSISRVFRGVKCFKPHLSHKQFILKVTVLVLQYVNL